MTGDTRIDGKVTIEDVLAWLRDDLSPERANIIRDDVRSPDSCILKLLRDSDLLIERLKETEPEAFARLKQNQSRHEGDLLKWLERHPQPDWSPLSGTEREAMKAQDALIEQSLLEKISDRVRRRDGRSKAEGRQRG